MPNKIDRNANSLDRLRRSLQRLTNGAIVSTIPAGTYLPGGTSLNTTAPITGGGFLSTGLTLALSASAIFSTIGGALSFAAEPSTTVLAGPTSGAAAVPTFRALVGADIPDLPYVDSVTAGDKSITIGGTADNPTVAVNLLPTGGLETTNTGVGISTVFNTTAPIAGGGNLSTGLTISIPQATSTANGYLSSTDWTTFNNKMAGTQAIATSDPITGGGTISTGLTIGVNDFKASGASHDRGTVPDPGSTAGTTRFLREDATWATPSAGGSSTTVYALDASISTLTSGSSTGVGVQKADASLYIRSNPSGSTTLMLTELFPYANGNLAAVDSGNWRTMQNGSLPGVNSSSTASTFLVTSSTVAGQGTLSNHDAATYAGGTAFTLTNGYLISTVINSQNTNASVGNGTGILAAVNSTTFTVTGNEVWVDFNLNHVALMQGNATLRASTAFGTQLSAGNHAVVLNIDSTGTIGTVTVDGTLYLSTNTLTAPGSADKLVGFHTGNGTDSIVSWAIGFPATMSGLAVQNDPNSGIQTGSTGLQSRLIFINTADSGTLTNVTTASTFSTSTGVPAAFFTPGKTLRITAAGQITVSSTQQVAISLITGVLGQQSVNFSPATSTSSVDWWAEMFVTCRAIGNVANNFHQAFRCVFNNDAATTSQETVKTALVQLNTGASTAILCQFAATVAHNTAFCRHFSVEVWN